MISWRRYKVRLVQVGHGGDIQMDSIFLPSKTSPSNQVANRYFSTFKDGTLKVRGIVQETRCAAVFKRCQEEILNELLESPTMPMN